MCENCVLTDNDMKFLDERREVASLSGARIAMINEERKELEKEMKKTKKELLLLL